MGFALKELGVNLGYLCNFRCAHCAVTEDPHTKLSPKEIGLLAKTLRLYKPKSLLFVGGEPTLYIDIANSILLKSGNISKTSVRITTNGHFANSRADAVRTLSSFVKLDKVQLSYDKFHAKFLPFENIKNLFDACRLLGKKFNVITSIENPLDILLVEKIKKAGRFSIGIQKVLPTGRAKTNKLYHTFPSLDEKVLKKGCPNKGKIMYFCGRGFSVCCSSLVFNERKNNVVHPSVLAHVKSEFYKNTVLSTFGRFARKLGVPIESLRAEHSAPCNLCEYLFGLVPEKYDRRRAISGGGYNVQRT